MKDLVEKTCFLHSDPTLKLLLIHNKKFKLTNICTGLIDNFILFSSAIALSSTGTCTGSSSSGAAQAQGWLCSLGAQQVMPPAAVKPVIKVLGESLC